MRIVVGLLVILLAQISQAATYQATGAIQKIFSLDRSTWGANSDSFLLSGFASAGTCATNDALVGVVLRDDEGGKRQLAILLAAKVSGTSINIRADDSIKNSFGYCYLQVLELNRTIQPAASCDRLRANGAGTSIRRYLVSVTDS